MLWSDMIWWDMASFGVYFVGVSFGKRKVQLQQEKLLHANPCPETMTSHGDRGSFLCKSVSVSTLVPDSFKRCILFIPISFLSISMTIFCFFTFTVSFSHSDKKKKIIWLAISCALSAPVHCHLLCIASLHCQCALPVCPISVTSHGERGSILCKCHAHSSTL